jgi:hypothetical protein
MSDGPIKAETKTQAIAPVFKVVQRRGLQAYRSSIGNLFTSTDETLSKTGFVELLTEKGYWGDVIKSLWIYETCDIVKGLVNRQIDCSCNGYNFQVPEEDELSVKVFSEWGNRINEGTKTVLPGIETINEWITKSLALTGMAIPDLEWGVMEIEKKKYKVPVKINVLPSLGVKVKSSTIKFGEEQVWLGINENEAETLSTANKDENYKVRFMGIETTLKKDANGEPIGVEREAYEANKPRPNDEIRSSQGLYAVERPNAFVIKYGWTPQDKTYYPIVPLKSIFQIIALRYKIVEAQISALEDVITDVMLIKVGDKDVEITPDLISQAGNIFSEGDLSKASKILEEGEARQIIAVPWYYNIEWKQANLTLLTDQSHMVASNQAILNAFGVVQDPDARGNTNTFEEINTKTFTRQLEKLQKYIERYWGWVINQIMEKNPSLKVKPNLKLNPPNVDSTDLKRLLFEMYKGGALSHQTLMDRMEIDESQETARKKMEDKDLWEAPVSFNQASKDMLKDGSSGGKPLKDKPLKEKKPVKPKKAV